MKKQFIVGMLVMAFAAPVLAAAGKSGKAVDANYLREIRKAAFAGKSSAKGLSEAESTKATNLIISELTKESMLSKNDEAAIRGALSSAKGKSALLVENKGMTRSEEILENLATIIAAKKTAEQNKDTSLVEASKDAVKLISLGELNGSISSKEMNKEQQELATQAVEKLISLSTSSMSKFEGMEAAQMQKVIKEMIKLTESSKMLPEEALIQSIMTVMKVDRNTALDTAKKLKECV